VSRVAMELARSIEHDVYKTIMAQFAKEGAPS
jgi:hypothetical protein